MYRSNQSWGKQTGITDSSSSKAAKSGPSAKRLDASKPEDSGSSWAILASGGPTRLKQKLKAARFSDELVRAIVEAHVGEIYRMKRNAVYGSGQMAERPYWQSQTPFDFPPARKAELVRLQREEGELLSELLQDLPQDDSAVVAVALRHRYGDLSDEKALAVRAVEERYRMQSLRTKEETLRGQAGGNSTRPPDVFFATDREMRGEMAKILTPEELFAYDLRNSAASMVLKEDAALLDITEAEYRDMYLIYQNALDKIPAADLNRNDKDDVAGEMRGGLQAPLQTLLGEERYADYLQAKNPDQKKLNLIARRLELPISAARAVVSVQKEIMQRAKAVSSDVTFNAEQRAAYYSLLAREAEAGITRQLGSSGYEAYCENSQKWIQSLEKGQLPRN